MYCAVMSAVAFLAAPDRTVLVSYHTSVVTQHTVYHGGLIHELLIPRSTEPAVAFMAAPASTVHVSHHCKVTRNMF